MEVGGGRVVDHGSVLTELPIKFSGSFKTPWVGERARGKGLEWKKNPGFSDSRESCKLPWHFPTRRSQQRHLKKTFAQDLGSRKLGMKLPGLWKSVCERAFPTWAGVGEGRGRRRERLSPGRKLPQHLHQGWFRRAASPLEGCQGKSLERPTVRPRKLHAGSSVEAGLPSCLHWWTFLTFKIFRVVKKLVTNYKGGSIRNLVYFCKKNKTKPLFFNCYCYFFLPSFPETKFSVSAVSPSQPLVLLLFFFFPSLPLPPPPASLPPFCWLLMGKVIVL